MKALRLILLLCLACSLHAQSRLTEQLVPSDTSTPEVIDRIVAVVNREPILQSDWGEAMRYEALMAGRPIAELTPADAKAALDRIIDQKLLLQQMQGFRLPAPSPAEINDKLTDVRELYPAGKTDSGWRAALARYGLSEKAVNSHLSSQLQVMQFIDMRLRPEAKVTPQAVEDYYRKKLLPKLGDVADRPSSPTPEITAQIQELLTQEKIDELLTSWLRGLREQAQIHVQAAQNAVLSAPNSADSWTPVSPRADARRPQAVPRDR
jgi:hypothetical protein